MQAGEDLILPLMHALFATAARDSLKNRPAAVSNTGITGAARLSVLLLPTRCPDSGNKGIKKEQPGRLSSLGRQQGRRAPSHKGTWDAGTGGGHGTREGEASRKRSLS